jgi:hypothetical protein
MELKIGDKIKIFHLTNEVDCVYEITGLTKTQARSTSGNFKKEIILYSTLPNKDKFIGEAIAIKPYSNARYFVLRDETNPRI